MWWQELYGVWSVCILVVWKMKYWIEEKKKSFWCDAFVEYKRNWILVRTVMRLYFFSFYVVSTCQAFWASNFIYILYLFVIIINLTITRLERSPNFNCRPNQFLTTEYGLTYTSCERPLFHKCESSWEQLQVLIILSRWCVPCHFVQGSFHEDWGSVRNFTQFWISWTFSVIFLTCKNVKLLF